jgi:hypothetical protein
MDAEHPTVEQRETRDGRREYEPPRIVRIGRTVAVSFGSTGAIGDGGGGSKRA